MKKLLRFLFVPSMEGMGMGCLMQMVVWGIIICAIAFTVLGAWIF